MLALIGVIVAVLVFLAQQFLQRKSPFSSKDIIILTPKHNESIEVTHGEGRLVKRDIVGKITGFTKREIEKLGLFIEVHIKTDIWYLQGKSPVAIDGKWKVEGRFGGRRHIIKAELKDIDGTKYLTKEIEVTVVR